MKPVFIEENWMHDLKNEIQGQEANDPPKEYDVRAYSFERLDVWNRSIDLVEWIYDITASFPGEEKFILTAQIRRSAISVPSNIAEGVHRRSNKDKIHFLNIAYSSLIELLTQIIIGKRLGFIDEELYVEGRKKIQAITAMIQGLSRAFSK
ncbi:MAG: four helix bundle protein [Saprospiraceae bacterium]|nr:four helix bundle protein [Saprospiraceae bacterium]